jgi:formate dehydrogenase assembly factor FdhD
MAEELAMSNQRLQMTQAAAPATFSVVVVNASGRRVRVEIPCEIPLSIRLDGREIVMKAAWMKIPVLISKSGTTQMGLELAQDLGLTMIGRVKKSRFLVYTGSENLIFDAPPERGDD